MSRRAVVVSGAALCAAFWGVLLTILGLPPGVVVPAVGAVALVGFLGLSVVIGGNR